jgi:cyclase
MTVRIIARLDMKPPAVIKPVHFEGYRRIGSPADVAARYCAQGVDELFCEDVVASLFERDVQVDTMRAAAQAGWIPVTLGGGIRTMADCETLFACGADKVAINTAAVRGDGSLIRAASRVFGPQSVVTHVTARRDGDGWIAMTDMGRIESRWSALDWVREAEQLGAGEIIVSSVDRDGRRGGFDVTLLREAVRAVRVPVVAASGAGSVEDVVTMVRAVRPSAVAIGSLLHYGMATVSDIRAALAADDPGVHTPIGRPSLVAERSTDGVRHAA